VACEMDRLEVVKTLLSSNKGVDITVNEQYCFLVACEKGFTNLVSFLLTLPDVDPTLKDNHAIRIACEFGHVGVVKLLLKDKRIDPGSQNNYAIRHAAQNVHTTCLNYLKQDPRVDPNVLNNTEENYRHLDSTRKTMLNNSDISTTPQIFIKNCTNSSGHEWHMCRSNHRHPNHVDFPTTCHTCKQSLPFTANLCNRCGIILCVKCSDR